MKRVYFAALFASVILLFAFSGLKVDNEGSYTIEDKTYTPTKFSHRLPSQTSSYPTFEMIGWVSASAPTFGTYSIAFVGKSVPETGVYPLQDFAKTGQASLLISTPKPGGKNYRAQSGEVHVTNKGGKITATFKNVPVKSDVGGHTSVASGTISIKL